MCTHASTHMTEMRFYVACSADAARRPFVEVQIHSPVRFEQDVEFMAVHEAELEQPGVMEQVEAFAQRYHIAVKRVDSAGVLSPLGYAPATTPRAHLDAARRQHEHSTMATATRRRTRVGSMVTDVPSHWSMVKPGIRRVDVTEKEWKGVMMRDHFQQLVDSSIDQVGAEYLSNQWSHAHTSRLSHLVQLSVMQKRVSLRSTIGKGRDTQWRNTGFAYDELVVEKVYRIEHTERWRMFRNRRQVR